MNIPSHAVDIRHMFRATPQKDYTVESEVDDNNEVSFVIDNGHELQTSEGYKPVVDVVPGDVVMFDDKEVSSLIVKEVETKGTSTRVRFDVI